MADYGGLMQLGDLARGLTEGAISYKQQSNKEKKEQDALAQALKEREVAAALAAKNRGEDQEFQREKFEYQKSNDEKQREFEKYKAQLSAKNKSSEDQLAKKGKILPGGEISAVAEANAITKQLGDLESNLGASKLTGGGLLQGLKRKGYGLLGSVTGSNKEADEIKSLESNQGQTAQIVGKYLEGGKLTDTDIERYKSMLPSVGDTEKVRSGKVASLKKLVSDRQQALAKGYGEAGYDVSGISLADKVPEQAARPQDNAAKAWAEANPQDPRAAKILQKLGGAQNGIAR